MRGGIIPQADRYLGGFCASQRIFPPQIIQVLLHAFMAHCNTMICQQVTLSGEAEWPKVADAVIEAKPCALANEDDQRRRCPKASKYG